jgi:uncharacterized SAM-binding protein YcdF (DUF218 family)
MFFYIAKILWFFAQPSNALLTLLLVGTAMLWSRWARWGRRIVLWASLLLLLAGLSPLGHAIILPLENRFDRARLETGAPPDGIVVLGGAQDMSIIRARGVVAVNEAAERLIEAATLARRFPEARIMFSGGSNALFGDRDTEALGARELLVKLGVAPERLLLEDKSRDTYENAAFSARLAAPKAFERWLLITSASHMPRAMGCFRTARFAVEPWPVDFRTRGVDDIWRFFPKPSEGLRRVDLAMREWLGLLAYRVTGRTSRLFPGP